MDAHFDQTFVENIILEDAVAVTDTIWVKSHQRFHNINCSIGSEESDVNSAHQSVLSSQMVGSDVFFLENERLCDNMQMLN